VDKVVPFRLGAEQPDQPAGAGLKLGKLHDDGVGTGPRSQITPGDHDDINFAAADLDGLVRIIKRKLKKIQYRPHLINGCLAATGLRIEPW
jgi:hypothetical protein